MIDQVAEQELVDRLRSRHHSAVEAFESAYGSQIHRLAVRYLKNHEDAEEVTQDVLFQVSRKIDGFRRDAALSSWIYRITFNARDVSTAKHQVQSTVRGAASGRCRPV